MVAASGSLVLISGLGAVLGPVLIASIMERYGTQSFFWSMGAVHGLIGVFAVVRMLMRAPVPLDKQGPVSPSAAPHTGSVMEGIQQLAHDEALDDELGD
jgi:MFS family permease